MAQVWQDPNTGAWTNVGQSPIADQPEAPDTLITYYDEYGNQVEDPTAPKSASAQEPSADDLVNAAKASLNRADVDEQQARANVGGLPETQPSVDDEVGSKIMDWLGPKALPMAAVAATPFAVEAGPALWSATPGVVKGAVIGGGIEGARTGTVGGTLRGAAEGVAADLGIGALGGALNKLGILRKVAGLAGEASPAAAEAGATEADIARTIKDERIPVSSATPDQPFSTSYSRSFEGGAPTWGGQEQPERTVEDALGTLYRPTIAPLDMSVANDMGDNAIKTLRQGGYSVPPSGFRTAQDVQDLVATPRNVTRADAAASAVNPSVTGLRTAADRIRSGNFSKADMDEFMNEIDANNATAKQALLERFSRGSQ